MYGRCPRALRQERAQANKHEFGRQSATCVDTAVNYSAYFLPLPLPLPLLLQQLFLALALAFALLIGLVAQLLPQQVAAYASLNQRRSVAGSPHDGVCLRLSQRVRTFKTRAAAAF